MKIHYKIYYKYFGYDISDWIGCEYCGATSKEIHHLDNKGMGGSKTKDYIENLVAVCRNCHNKAHDSKEFNERLKTTHLYRIEKWP